MRYWQWNIQLIHLMLNKCICFFFFSMLLETVFLKCPTLHKLLLYDARMWLGKIILTGKRILYTRRNKHRLRKMYVFLQDVNPLEPQKKNKIVFYFFILWITIEYECIIFTVQWIEKLIVLPSATLRNTLPWYQNILNIHVLDLEILLTWDII